MSDAALTHAEVDALLPMLIAGALTDAQSRAVREHVATCLACRREQKYLALVRDGVRANPADADAPRPDPASVLKRIDDYEERRRRNPFLRYLWFGREHPLLALAAQAALILLAVFLLVSPIEPEPQFVTLSQPDSVPAGRYVRAVFAPALDDRSVAGIARSMNFEIVHGPTERGVYTLAPSPAADTADYESLADKLRARDEVLFAEPVIVGDAQ